MLKILGAIAIAITLPVIAAAENAATSDSVLIDFKLKDQFDTVHRRADFEQHIVVLLAFDRKGSEYRDQWLTALQDSLPNISDSARIDLVPLAHLRGVPFFLKGMIKGKLPREEDRWMLLDWKGRFDKAYAFDDDVCTVLIFSPQGKLVYRDSVTELSMDTLAELLAATRSQLP